MAREYKRNPDDIRGWEYADYVEALEELGEVPPLSDLIFHGFFGKPKPEPVSLRTPEARIAALARMGKT